MGGSAQDDDDSTQNMVISGDDGRINYTGSWTIGNSGKNNSDSKNSEDGKKKNKDGSDGDSGGQHGPTFHSTATNRSTVSLTFQGSEIQVRGPIPLGQGNLTANYTIDGGEPRTRSIAEIVQGHIVNNAMLFRSGPLNKGPHTIKIEVLSTGNGRNYAIQNFVIAPQGGKNAAAIVGGVLGSIIFILLLLIGAFYYRRRRKFKQMYPRNSKGLRPIIFHAEPMGYGDPMYRESYPRYTFVDTDSKFTFNHMINGFSEGSKSRGVSWVPVSLPPSLPRSAVVHSRISDWSSYRGSSIDLEKSREEPQKSYFSPLTSASMSTMAFRDSPPPPLPPPSTPPPPAVPRKPLQIDTLTISTMGTGFSRKGEAL